MFTDASALPRFQIKTDSRNDWIRWRRAFELWASVSQIQGDQEKANWLLVAGGIDLQEIVERIPKYGIFEKTLQEDGSAAKLEYESLIASLDAHFAPKLNKRFERHLLRAVRQEQNETFADFSARVNVQANKCDFPNDFLEDAMIDQLVEGCLSPELRKKMLSEDKTLDQILNMGKSIEQVEKQTRIFGRKETFGDTVGVLRSQNRSNSYRFNQNRPNQSRANENSQKYEQRTSHLKCYNCAQFGHIAREISKCSAANTNCGECGRRGHISKCCRKRKLDEPNVSRSFEPQPKRIKAIFETEPQNEENDDWRRICMIKNGAVECASLKFLLGNVEVTLLVDSGSPANILTLDTFNFLKENEAEMMNLREVQLDEIFTGKTNYILKS